MHSNYLGKLALTLMASVAIAASSCKAGEDTQPAAIDAQPHDYNNQSLLFQNLVTDDAALEAWNNIPGKQAEVNCDPGSVPLGQFTRNIGNLYSNQFDIIWPSDDRDPDKITLKMRLKDVRAIEIFNAMNFYFEAQLIPAHWKLAVNGNRPTAILTMTKNQPGSTAPVAPERKTTVFGISGPLYASGPGNYKQAAASLTEALEAVLDDISDKPRRGSNGEIREGPPVIKIHPEAAILVFTGTPEETELIRSTLGALNDGLLHKAEVIERDQKAKEQKANIDGDTKPPHTFGGGLPPGAAN